MCFSSHAPSIKRKITLRFTGRFRIMSPQYGTFLISPFWRQEFNGAKTFRELVCTVSVNQKQCEIHGCDSSADVNLSLLGYETLSIGKCSDHTVSNPWRRQSVHYSLFHLHVIVDTDWGVGCCWCLRCEPWYYIQNGLLVGPELLVKLTVCIQEVIVMLFI